MMNPHRARALLLPKTFPIEQSYNLSSIVENLALLMYNKDINQTEVDYET